MRRRYYNFDHRDKIEKIGRESRPIRSIVPRKRKRVGRYFAAALFILLLGLGIYLASSMISSANNMLSNNISVKDIFSKSSLKQTDGITNILLLGRDQAAQLTDTIEIIRIRQSDKKVAMISIPRDFQVKVPGDGTEKINAVYKIGYANEKDEKKKVDTGVKLASKTIEQVSGVPIHYYITADFIGLKNAVDILGGITINVKNDFYDPEYPRDYFTKDGKYVKTDGFDPFSLKAGTQKMDGTTALKYARSRHGNNGEGSDFARAARQQQIIMAVKDKALSIGVLSNPAKISGLLNSIGSSVKTNMTLSELKEAVDFVKDVDKTQIISKVLSDDPKEGVLVSINEGGYYLIPKAGRTNYSEIQAMVKGIFSTDTQTAQAISANIEVFNGSGITGAAGKVAEKLKALGYVVTKVETNKTDIDETTIYSSVPSSPQIDKIKSTIGKTKVSSFDQSDTIKIIIGRDYGK